MWFESNGARQWSEKSDELKDNNIRNAEVIRLMDNYMISHIHKFNDKNMIDFTANETNYVIVWTKFVGSRNW
jgi:hypothetical protein